ncbi:hypothetical protein LSAT2_009832 [Lamellibrachia satsuma]|nr:hypothetical protein LSAT2_009832 [Lamellibrachia satsuma]
MLPNNRATSSVGRVSPDRSRGTGTVSEQTALFVDASVVCRRLFTLSAILSSNCLFAFVRLRRQNKPETSDGRCSRYFRVVLGKHNEHLVGSKANRSTPIIAIVSMRCRLRKTR